MNQIKQGIALDFYGELPFLSFLLQVIIKVLRF